MGAALLCAAGGAKAGPLAFVGDRQLRQDVELLKAAGYINGPIDSWPLAWSQIDAGLARAEEVATLPSDVAAAAARLRTLSDLAAQSTMVEARIATTNEPALARDFSTLARADGEASGRLEVNLDRVSVSLGGTLRTGDGRFEPDGTALTMLVGNWALHAGWTEHWFGPGSDGALLFSNATRPFPKIGLKRLIPQPINLPVLRWLGPVQFEIFGGVLDEQRADYNDILTVGTRLSFEPVRGLTIGLNRAQMLCGKGRPCGFSQIAESFIGIGNADNPTSGQVSDILAQPGNQLAGFDISFTRRFGSISAKLYAEAEAEDFDNIILEQFGRLVGVTLTGPLGRSGATWSANLEYADTQAASLFNGTPLEKLTGGETVYPGSLYNNFLYFGGFRYNQRPIGYWTDGDSRNLALNLSLTDARNRRFFAAVRSVHLNFNNVGSPPLPGIDRNGNIRPLVTNSVSANREKLAILSAGTECPTSFGDIRAEARWQSDSPNTPDRRVPKGAVEIGWRIRF